MKDVFTIEEVRKIRRAANLRGYEEGFGRGLSEGLRLSEEALEAVLSGEHPPLFTDEELREQDRFLANLFASAIPPPLHPRTEAATTQAKG